MDVYVLSANNVPEIIRWVMLLTSYIYIYSGTGVD